MRKKFTAFLALTTLFTSAIFFLPEKNHRAEYTAYLQNHPWHPKNRRQIDPGSMLKQDRPDLAWEQNFLMTMDPRLKRPTPEKLEAGRKQIAAFFKAKSAARTGTEDFPWIERGPKQVGGRTRAVMWDPNDENGSKVWAGGVTGGLWYNNNILSDTSVWTKVDDFWESISITSIVSDPTNPQVFYAGTGENTAGASRGEGIYKSTDAGTTWEQLSATTAFHYINDMIVRDEDGTGVLYAAVAPAYYAGDFHGVPSLGLQRSANGGTSFTQVLPDIDNTPHAVADLELASDNTIWAGTVTNVYNDGGGFILSSTDGLSWDISTQRIPGDRIMLSSAPSNPDVVYALVENGAAVEEIIKTTDGGFSWENVAEPNDADPGISADDFSRGQAWYDLIIEVDPNNENVVLVGGIDLFKTDDGGSTWDQLSHWYGEFGSQYVHADQHAILFKPGSSSDVLFGNDGGVYVSSSMNTSTPTISMRNNSYNVTQFYACAIHPTQDNFFLAGAQDNGTHKFSVADLGDTKEVYGGDGAYCFIDQADGDLQISSYVFNVYARSTNNGVSFFDFADDQNSGRFINPADYDDTLGILYTATDELSIGRFTNIRTNPTRNDFDVDLNGDLASHLRVSPYQTTSTTLFVGTGSGNIFKIENANGASPSAEDITGSLPAGYIACIEIGASEDQLLVTFSSYGIIQVWESLDGGATWNGKNGNLPDMPVRWALYNPNDRSEVILATELGIWRTEDISMASPVWEPSSIGLANVRVDMLQIRESDLEVIAATHGRGLYSSSGFTRYEIPSAPSDLTLTTINAHEILVEWTDNSDNETGFVVERSEDSITFEKIAEVAADINTYSDTGLEEETTYWYRVKGVNVSASSKYTTEEAITTLVILSSGGHKKEAFTVYPVPAHTSLTIKATGQLRGTCHYALVDMGGRTVAADYLTREVATLNVSSLKSGVYHLILQNGKTRYRYKISKI